MSYTTELTQDCLGIVHAGSGVVTSEELLAGCVTSTHLVQNTENFQYEFIDFSEMKELRFQPDDLDRIVAQDAVAALARPRAIVVVVAPQEDTYQFALKWRERIEDLDWTIHISRERSEAIRWLGNHLKTERPELLAQRPERAA